MNSPAIRNIQDRTVELSNALDLKMDVSITSGGVYDTKPKNERATMRELIPQLEKQHDTPNKLSCPMVKLGCYKGGVKADNIEVFSGVMGDYDAGKVQPAAAAEMLKAAGIGGVIATTASHTDEEPRWRVLCPLSEPTDSAGLLQMTGRVNAALGGILGKESFVPAQRFFTGVPRGSVKPQVIGCDGKPVDLVQGLTPIIPARPERQERVRNTDPCPYDFDTCLAALAALDPNRHLTEDRGAHYEWLRNTVWAFKDATGGGKEAQAAALQWREGKDGIDAHERAKFNRIWRSDTGKTVGIGWGTLFHNARETGWVEWTAADFDDLPPIDDQDPPDLNDPDDVNAYLLGTPRKKDRFAAKLEWAHEIQPVIESSYLLEDRLSLNGLSVCYGAPNAGKTFFLLQMAFHLAQGKTFYGSRCKPTAVLYLALEGGALIANRVSALAREVGSHIPFALRRAGFNLLKPDGDVKEIIGLHDAMMRHVGDMPSMIVIDTLSRALAGGDENSPKDMTAFVRNVDAIRQATGAHVMIVHHCGKDEARGMRGHSSLLGAIDTELQIKAADTGGVRTAEFGKQRDYAEDHKPLGFTLRSVVLGVTSEGKEVRTAIADPAEVETSYIKPVKLSKGAQAALDILKAAGGKMTERQWQESAINCPRLSDAKDKDGKRKAFNRARTQLVNTGVVDCSGGLCVIWDPSDLDNFDDLE